MRCACCAFVLALALPAERADSQRGPVVPAGTHLLVRLDRELSTRYDRRGVRFSGTLDTDVMHNGSVVLTRGTTLWGTITELQVNNQTGLARLVASMNAISIAGTLLPIVTDTIGAEGRRGSGLSKVGQASLVGAVFGGAGAGVAGGSSVSLRQRGSDIEVREGTLIGVTLLAPLHLRR
jgi:hypothetical protein